ncbi:FAD-dependent oxidoreductase [Thalassotalea atypica]|uniref:FAD-dependent oxidoreductase n=1 Tax=Thalassotalea atypica TaxID=2054316 RepID=UPI002573D5BE|nr:FAD-dependent oxidoreductase [Thalassotalea atypica]
MDIKKKENIEFFHQVVDCQYACPAHTPVPEYIRLIAQGKYNEAYMVNWQSNVFPGILGRTCDRPCEPACRRGRLGDDEEPVAICRLKRVASDNKNNISSLLPNIPTKKNGKRIALIGAGPASLTVARDLMPLGYNITLYDEQYKGGGMIRSQIPSFRLPDEVLDEEVNYVLDMGVHTLFNQRVDSLKAVLQQNFDAVFIGTGAPKGRDLALPGREEARANIHIGVEWLANVAFKHTSAIGKKVIVLGGGNTAMDCCRTALRLGGKDVTVTVRSPFESMKASPWEIEDAQHEGIPILDNHVPKEFIVEDSKLVAMRFEKVKAEFDEQGNRSLIPLDEPPVIIECDDVLIAVGQSNSFPWIERDIGIAFNKWDMPKVNRETFATTHEKVFIGGDAAFGPENIITAVAHGHQAAISIDLYCHGKDIKQRPDAGVNLLSQKMGVHEWSYDSPVSNDDRNAVPLMELKEALKNLSNEVELGFDEQRAISEAARCLNCDMQTVFTEDKCIECDACVDVCPTKVLTMTGKEEDESTLRDKLTIPAKNLEQPLYVSGDLATGRVMVKDEDICLHCGLCAERCPTGAWDLQQFTYIEAKACDNLAHKAE